MLIIVCSLLSLNAFPNIAKRKLYKLNLLGFICSAILIHVILPLLTGNRELYYTAMPLPWATTGLQLMAAMVFWVFWIERGYCHYCPLGTFLSLIAKLGKQRITTTITACIGCGHCVDACPVQTLKYETAFIQKVNKTCKFV